uniref:Uncharacterized protein n=1 Tax=Arundo donax TaxID=35708 RepID=A0A0A9AQX1_ARUDO
MPSDSSTRKLVDMLSCCISSSQSKFLGSDRSTRRRFSFQRTSLRNLLLRTSSTQCSPPPAPACGGRSPHPSKK